MTDDTDMLQEALDDAAIGGGGTVRLQATTYTTTRPLRWPGPKVNLRGSGPNATVINFRGSGAAVQFGRSDLDRTNPATAGNWSQIRLSDMVLDGTGSAPGSVGVDVYGASRYTIERVNAHHFPRAAFELRSGWVGTISDCRAADSHFGLKATHPGPPGTQSFNAVTLRGGEWGPGCEIAVLVGEEDQPGRTTPVIGSGLVLDGCTVEGAKRWGVAAFDGNGLVVRDCYFEANSKGPTPGQHTGHVLLGNGGSWAHGTTITGCNFFGGLGPDPAKGCCVYARDARFLWVDGCRFDTGTRGAYAVKIGRDDPRERDVPTEPGNFFAASIGVKVGP